MITYLGLDVASATGWSFLEDDRLIERGTIQLMPQMDLPQKLHYFHLELRSLLTRLQPQWIFIEDVFLGISGAKTLAYLARLNGVAIATAFEVLQERVKLYQPNYWKANSFEGLRGDAKKWQTQLAVLKHYRINVTGNFSNVDALLEEVKHFETNIHTEWDETRTTLAQLKSRLVSKRNPLNDEEKVIVNSHIKKCTDLILIYKKSLKAKEKELDKKFAKITIDISAQTGITENIADSIAIAYCGYKETR